SYPRARPPRDPRPSAATAADRSTAARSPRAPPTSPACTRTTTCACPFVSGLTVCAHTNQPTSRLSSTSWHAGAHEGRAGPLRRSEGLFGRGVHPGHRRVARAAPDRLGRGRDRRAPPAGTLGERLLHAP